MRVIAALLAAIIAYAGLAGAADAQRVTGAGATFPAPLYGAWANAARAAIGLQVNYQSLGSAAGVNQILNRTVDFGASDAPLDADRLASGNLLQFPTVTGAVVLIVNIPGVAMNELKLTGKVLGDIYLGRIRRWNDKAITSLNPGLHLPNTTVAPIFRAEGSGTTFIFTSYLSAESDDWKGHVGRGTSVRWPAGTGARGNDGVASSVRNVRGSIGYVENAFASQNNLITAQLRNKAGNFVTPTIDSFAAAASAADWKNAPNFAVNLIDQPGEKTWPIVSATFILLPTDARDPERSRDVMRFFDWAYTSGGDIASNLEYIPLPKEAQDTVREAWRAKIKGADGKPLF